MEYLEKEDRDLLVNLGTSKGLSVFQILEAARRVSGVEFPVTVGPRRKGDPAVVLSSAEKAEKLLGWDPRFSSAETLLETMLVAYRNRS